jgi:hypothetical protein
MAPGLPVVVDRKDRRNGSKILVKMALDTAEKPAGYEPAAKGVSGVLSIDGLDQRRRPFRRYETIRGAVLGDLGGEESTSEIQRQLISKFATLALQLEEMEAAALAGNEIDVDLFGRCAGHLRRIAEVHGLRRVPKDVPDLHTYLAAKATEHEGEAA